jgi:hypothetical protein
VQSSEGGRCTAANIGENVTVRYQIPASGAGSVAVRIPLLPDITLTPTITAAFRCEV